ncbi:hypothetical protein V8C35DRAFT_294236 [Trichoderma chlorosporum]
MCVSIIFMCVSIIYVCRSLWFSLYFCKPLARHQPSTTTEEKKYISRGPFTIFCNTLQIILSIAMATEIEEPIYEEDLDALHSKVLGNAFIYIAEHANIQWQYENDYVKTCKDKTLINITKDLKSDYYAAQILRISPSIITLYQSGDLIPLRPSVGCSIHNGEVSYQLNLGKKLHIPTKSKQLKLYVEQNSPLYLLWLFKTERDFKTKEGPSFSQGKA